MATNVRPLIRLPKRSYATLKALSKETKKPMSDLAAEAIEHYSDERFWDEVDRELEAMTPAQWQRYRKEFELWERATIADGLQPEDWSAQERADAKREAASRRRVVGRSRSRPRT